MLAQRTFNKITSYLEYHQREDYAMFVMLINGRPGEFTDNIVNQVIIAFVWNSC